MGKLLLPIIASHCLSTWEEPNCIKAVKGQSDTHRETLSTLHLNYSIPDYFFIKAYGVKQIKFSRPFLSNLLYKYKNPRYMKMVLNYICLFTA